MREHLTSPHATAVALADLAWEWTYDREEAAAARVDRWATASGLPTECADDCPGRDERPTPLLHVLRERLLHGNEWMKNDPHLTACEVLEADVRYRFWKHVHYAVPQGAAQGLRVDRRAGQLRDTRIDRRLDAAAPHPPRPTEACLMQDFTFTGLWPQTEGNPLVTFTWRGVTPVDAIVRQWATCFPDTVLGSPLRCEADGHTYHLRLDEHGYREIKVIARAMQFVTETI
jgi:hypothetical protein